tara:strand:+ start:351 stop:503 length:153 start_codon:yes stop_codon:yes gene_type:complete
MEGSGLLLSPDIGDEVPTKMGLRYQSMEIWKQEMIITVTGASICDKISGR